MKLPTFKVGSVNFAPATIDAVAAALGVLLFVLGSPLAGIVAIAIAANNSSDWRHKQLALIPLGVLFVLLGNLWLLLAAAGVGALLASKKVPHALPGAFVVAAAVSLIFGMWTSFIVAGVLAIALWFQFNKN